MAYKSQYIIGKTHIVIVYPTINLNELPWLPESH